jgi:hypothetical protein
MSSYSDTIAGFYRHVSFETVLGLASHHDPASYWNIIGRENPRRSTHTTMRTRRSPTQIEH